MSAEYRLPVIFAKTDPRSSCMVSFQQPSFLFIIAAVVVTVFLRLVANSEGQKHVLKARN